MVPRGLGLRDCSSTEPHDGTHAPHRRAAAPARRRSSACSAAAPRRRRASASSPTSTSCSSAACSTSLVEPLSALWHDIAEVRARASTRSTPSAEMRTGRAPSEPTLALTMEARLERTSVDDVAAAAARRPSQPSLSRVLQARRRGRRHRDPRTAARARRPRRVDVTLRAEVADIHMPLQRGPRAASPATSSGSTPPADAEVTLYADDAASTAPARGRSGTRRAVQILGPAEADADERRAGPAAARRRTADAVQDVARTLFAPDGVRARRGRVVAPDERRSTGRMLAGVAADVAYVDGVNGGNVMVMPARGRAPPGRGDDGHGPDERRGRRRALRAGALRRRRGDEPDDVRGRDGDRARSLGEEVEIAPPTHARAHRAERARRGASAGRAMRPSRFTLFGAPCRSCSSCPNAFVVRDDARARRAHAERDRRRDAAPATPLRDVDVRVWAELGRARMPPGALVGAARRRGRRARPRGRRRRSTSTSTACASPPAGSSSPTTASWRVRIEHVRRRRHPGRPCDTQEDVA